MQCKLTINIAPVVNEVGVKYNLEFFNGSLLKENIFRQDASPEVDTAWDSLGVNCPLSFFVMTFLLYLIILQIAVSGFLTPMQPSQILEWIKSKLRTNTEEAIRQRWRDFIISIAW